MSWSALNELWGQSLALPDTREIWEWAHDEVDLPNCYAVTGRFDADLVPFVKEPFRALREPTVREVVAQAGVQCLKTLIGELWLIWTIDQNPGPSQWLQTTNDEAKQHNEERFKFLVESCPRVHRYFSEDRHDKGKTKIIFKHMYLRMEGANDRGNLQRKSIKNQMCSEIWQTQFWKPGTLQEAGTRLTQFVYNSKRYIESQAGFADDQMEEAFKSGTQEVWGFKCQGCGKLQSYYWSYIRQDGTRAAMRWDENKYTRRENGEWIWGALVPTIRYECIYCGYGHTDDALTRRRILESGEYIVQNPNAPRTIRSFSWGQLAVTNLNWFETKTGGVKRFLWANDQAKKGNDQPLTEFFQKVVAEPYDPNKFYSTNRPPVILTSEEWSEEFMRVMTVDVQEDCFWAVIRAWAKSAESRLLWTGKLFTWGDVRKKQDEFKVYDGSVIVDSGDGNRTLEVYGRCAENGHIEIVDNRELWVCWKASKGEHVESFAYYTKAGPVFLPFRWPLGFGDPRSGKEGQGGKCCPLIQFSNPTIKDILVKLRDGKGAKWSTREDVCKEWHEHMYSERRVRVWDKLGQYQWKWENIGRRPNHLWDCEVLQVVSACMEGILGEQV